MIINSMIYTKQTYHLYNIQPYRKTTKYQFLTMISTENKKNRTSSFIYYRDRFKQHTFKMILFITGYPTKSVLSCEDDMI